MLDRLDRDVLLGHKSSSSNPHTLLQQGGVAHDAGLLVALRDVLCLLCVAGQSRG